MDRLLVLIALFIILCPAKTAHAGRLRELKGGWKCLNGGCFQG